MKGQPRQYSADSREQSFRSLVVCLLSGSLMWERSSFILGPGKEQRQRQEQCRLVYRLGSSIYPYTGSLKLYRLGEASHI